MSRAAGVSKSISGFDPRSIAGCCLWLDGADSRTINSGVSITNGTQVTSWKDKSIFLNHATPVSNATIPVYWNTNTIGGLPAIYMCNAPQFRGAFSTRLTGSNISVFTVAYTSATMPNALGHDQRLVSLTSNNTTSIDYSDTTGFMALDNQNTLGNLTSYYNYPTVQSVSSNQGQVTNYSTLVTSNVFLASVVAGNAVVNAWYNGQLFPVTGGIGPAVNALNIGNYGVGGGSYPTAEAWFGGIGEVLVYSNALSMSERQAVEGYLAWKWGIQKASTRNLIVGHSFYYLRPFTRIFQPYDIGSPFLWFDAADRRTIVGTSAVTSWTSKGSVTAVAGSAVGAPVSGTYRQNGLNTIFFPANSSLRYTVAQPNQARAWFFVYQTQQVTLSGSPGFTQYFSIINQTTGNGQQGIGGPGTPTNTGTASYGLGIGASGIATYVNTNVASNGANAHSVYAIVNSAVSTNLNFITQNGNSLTLNQSFLGTSYQTSSATYTIGDGFPYGNFVYVAEILCYNYEITVPQRQLIEGYLAHKWGRTTSFPAAHPYKKFPPSSAIPFLPTNFSSCALWLDAADPAGTGLTPANGTGISTWVDKTGSANSATAFTSINSIVTPTNPTLVTRSLNGLPGLSFPGTSGMKCPAFLTSSSGTVFMVVNFTSSSVQSFLVWKLKYSSFFAIAPGQVYVGVNNSGTYPAAGYDARATYTNIYGTPFVLGMTLSASSAASSPYTFVGSVNGTTTTTTGTSTSGNPSSCSDFVGIGVQVENGTAYYPMSGIIYEVIVYKDALSTEQRQKVEGYLACKWGLRSSLISTNPYKLYEPVQEGFLIVAAPGTPTGLTASNTTSTLNMSWTTGSGGTPATFTVTVYAGATLVATQTISYPTTSSTFSPMTSSVAYTFYVSATNTGGTSATAGPSNSVTYTAPQTVLITTVGAGSVVFGAGGTTLIIECWGGGGGSMGQDSQTGAGAGGAYSKTTVTGLSASGFTLFYSIGAGGVGSSSSGQVGGSTWGRVNTNAQPSSVTDGALAVGGNGSGVAGPNNSTQLAASIGQTKYIGGAGGYNGPENGGGGSASSLGNGTSATGGTGTAGGASGTGGGAGGSAGGFSNSGGDGISNVEGGGGGGGSYNNQGGMGGLPGGAGGMGWSSGGVPTSGVNTNPHGFGGNGGRGQIRYARS